jgi:hypothetical protein
MAWSGAIVAMAATALINAQAIAAFFGLIAPPGREATGLPHVPAPLAWAIFLIGLACIGYLLAEPGGGWSGMLGRARLFLAPRLSGQEQGGRVGGAAAEPSLSRSAAAPEATPQGRVPRPAGPAGPVPVLRAESEEAPAVAAAAGVATLDRLLGILSADMPAWIGRGGALSAPGERSAVAAWLEEGRDIAARIDAIGRDSARFPEISALAMGFDAGGWRAKLDALGAAAGGAPGEEPHRDAQRGADAALWLAPLEDWRHRTILRAQTLRQQLAAAGRVPGDGRT